MSEKARETFDGYKRRTSRWAIRMEYSLLHSEAYKSLTYGPAIKVLNWFHEKRSVDVDKKKRGGKRYKVRQEDISFTYDEAQARGLDHKKFSRAIRELHACGFLDVVRLGSGLRGNPNTYKLSDRWHAFGTDSFQHIPFPENRDWQRRFSVELYAGQERRHKNRDGETGKWTRRKDEKSQRLKTAVYGRPKTAVVNPNRRSKTAVENPENGEITTADIPSNLSTTKGCTALDTPSGAGEVRNKGVHDRGGPAETKSPSPKRWRPPLHEIRENVIEVLRQRPDPRAGNRRFTSLVSDRLQAAQRGILDAGRVHRDLRDQHDLDEWTVDLLFAITAIDIPDHGEATH